MNGAGDEEVGGQEVDGQEEAGVMVLDGLPVGAVLRLVGVDGGDRLVLQLMGLGLRIGEVITVTHVRRRGVVVACGAGRVAIGPELVRRIEVESVPR